jgi:double-GTPase-like protein
MAKRLACPYCYETFTAREILFRCNTRLSRTRKRCRAERDEVLQERLGQRREGGPVFAADGRKPTADCPTCEGETTYRVCPVCHSTLPAQFGMVDNRLIAMVGARDSGKTVFMTVLLHELMNKIGERYRISLMGSDDATMVRFGKEYQDKLYQQGQMLIGTRSAGANVNNQVDPLVFRFGLTRQRIFGDQPQHTVLSFFDTAGEDFNSRESVELNTRYLANADGIILILDPLQLPGARELALPGTLMPRTDEVDAPGNVLARITNLLLARTSGRGGARTTTPIAVVFAKMDALVHRLDAGSPLRAQPPQGGRFDDDDSLDVHHEVRDLLRQWDGIALDQTLENNYARYRYFGVTALGRTPTPEGKVAATGIQPYRVTDPLLWLLSEFGAVPRTDRRSPLGRRR